MRCISHVSDPKIMASQALFLIHKHLSHFLYLRRACHQIDFQGHIHIVAPKIVSTKHGSFFSHCHSTCRWPGCYEDCWFVATCATPVFALSHLRWGWYLGGVGQPCIPVFWCKKNKSGMIQICLPALALTGSHRHRPLPARGMKEIEHNLNW